MTETEGTMVSPQQIVLIPQLERTVRHFTGRGGHQEFEQFCEDLIASWAHRTDLSETQKANFVWSRLGKEVKSEISCQGIDFKDKAKLLEALQTTYGDQRPVSSLSLTFHSTRQEGYEGIRQFSTRLHTAFPDLSKQLQRHNSTLVDETCLKE
ncbi:hypothetical protein RRG08_026535 [Elysia crispata]|uniref:Uncharacterized protein n=1 Tax=Elysia crispata TaxID=231223 RepID=A0AAE0Y450_9GAST|nr:hypothetical protein RRG08_026535 [Elysia crispata]